MPPSTYSKKLERFHRRYGIIEDHKRMEAIR